MATGAGNTLGNKGAVAIFLKFGTTRLLVANAHLAAHQHAEEQRNSDFSKISRMLPILLDKREAQHAVSSRPRVLWGSDAPGGAKPDNTAFRLSSNRLGSSTAILREEAPSEISAGSLTPPPGARKGCGSGGNSVPADLSAKPTSSQPNLLSEENDSLSSDEDIDDPNITTTNTNSNTNTNTNTMGAVAAPRLPPQRPPQNRDNSSDLNSEASATSSSMTAAMLDEAKVGATAGRGGGRALSASYSSRLAVGEERSLDQCADAVIFMGDLNYRIKGNRYRLRQCISVCMYICTYVNIFAKFFTCTLHCVCILLCSSVIYDTTVCTIFMYVSMYVRYSFSIRAIVNSLLRSDMHEVLLMNDQLK